MLAHCCAAEMIKWLLGADLSAGSGACCACHLALQQEDSRLAHVLGCAFRLSSLDPSTSVAQAEAQAAHFVLQAHDMLLYSNLRPLSLQSDIESLVHIL